MSGSLLLDWAILSISLINVILTGWLGLTVLLNSERREWGVWLIGCGMLVGSLFFIAHAVIMGLGFQVPISTLNFWWRIGWLPLITLPVGWYVSILWYVGYWEDSASGLVKRQRIWFRITIALSTILTLLVMLTRTLPTFSQNAQLQIGNSLSFFNIPLLFLLFPISILLSIGLSIDALRHPEPSPRFLGDQSRQLARPWLIGAAWALLVVTLLVGGLIGWQLSTQSADRLIASVAGFTRPIALIDLLISTLICGVILLVGQAIVRYEIFTGKALPRGELRRQWFNVVVLAAGFSGTVSLSLGLEQAPIYIILLAALLITTFYALLNWRSYAHRDAYMAQLRPLVSNRPLHEQLLHTALPHTASLDEGAGSSPNSVDGSEQFVLLCRDLLCAQQAYLEATGSLSAFVRAPFLFPQTNQEPPAFLPDLVAQIQAQPSMGFPTQPSAIGIALNLHEADGYLWAIPLWSERGLNGIFLLGPKLDGTLYTQEEIEIARSTGERLVDTRATSEIARSLVLLQRNRLVESHLADQQTRRILHDDVLPQLHSLLIELSSSAQSLDETVTATVSDVHRQISNLLHEMPIQAAPHIAKLGLVGALESVVAQEMMAAFDAVHWQITPDVATIDQQLRESTLPISAVEVLYYAAREAMRNAARHGRGGSENRRLELTISVSVDRDISLVIEDNGVGIQHPRVSGAGASQGLALHSTMLAVLGGSLEIENEIGRYTRIRLSVRLESWGNESDE